MSTQELDPETQVWWCGNNQWAALEDSVYRSCGVYCGPKQLKNLPQWAQEELQRDVEKEGDSK